MARPLRVDVADGLYHVMARGIEGRAIFNDDRDRWHFLDLLAKLPERFRRIARRYTGMTLAELGEAAGGTDYAAVGMALRRLKLR